MSQVIRCKVSARAVESMGWDVFGVIDKYMAPFLVDNNLAADRVQWSGHPVDDLPEDCGAVYELRGEETI